MKNFITTLFLFIFSFGFSQNSGSVTINWSTSTSLVYETFNFRTPQFQYENFDFDLNKKQVRIKVLIQNNGGASENSLRISNIKYEVINDSYIGELDGKLYTDKLNEQLLTLQGRDDFSTLIYLNPFIREGNVLKKILSFDYSFDKNSNLSNFRSPASVIVNSVLASGNWYRFYVQKSGVYSLSKTFLKQLGLPIESIDPREIRIYGNGGRMLPLLNNTFYPNDLTENAIQINGESDGVFDDGDAVLFFGEGVDNWNESSQTFGNLYEDRSYYYVTTDLGAGKRIPEISQPIGSPAQSFSVFDDEVFYEQDLFNIGKVGRRWYGESFKTNNEQSFNFNIPNIVAGSQVFLTIPVASDSPVATDFNLEVNGATQGTATFSGNGTALFTESSFFKSLAVTDNFAIKLKYNNRGVPSSAGYLDYISIKCKRNLTGFGKQFRFQNNSSSNGSGVANYQISNASNISQVWNITNIWNVTKITNNQPTLSFNSNLGSLQKFVAIDNNDLYTPLKESNARIGNQDLKGTIFLDDFGLFQDIDYLIITPSFLNAQAQKLANFHRSYSNLNVKVVNLDNIYQEFSSGKQDIGAIRNFVKYVYNNATDPSKKVKFLNLFGDASYDFKNYNNRTKNNTNTVPIYHAILGNNLGASCFSSDDFYGLMNANEGNLDGNYGILDIAVGRMIVSSVKQADEIVNKVLEYHDIKAAGNWRNNIVLIGDDPNNQAVYSGDKSLQYYQNKLADEISANKPFMNVKKILLDSYKQDASSGGDRYPEARTDILNSFENGTLIIGYLGHGGEESLAQEAIWQKSDGDNLFNQYKYPLFITLTCSFSKFDNPTKITGGELTYWNPKGGAIAMAATTRQIGQTIAEGFNNIFMNKLLPINSSNYPTMAEAMRLAKNVAGGVKDVSFIGDPAMKLAIPKQKVVLTKVNDMPIAGPIDDFKSLGFIKLSGEIQDESNNSLTNYNGALTVNILDKNIPRQTLRNDNADAIIDNPAGSGTIAAPFFKFNTLGETIFRGNASVTNGKFEFGFVVPRDIRIPLDNGRISFYAQQENSLLDNTGIDTNIKIGGVNLLAPADNTPPKVRLYMNDETFVNGGITNESPIFLAFLEDENGINTAAGIGHDIIAYLDGRETAPYVLNQYYETEQDNYKKGKVRYQFRNLSVGLHTLTFKAFDVYNNLVTAELQFIVVGNETLTLTNVLNYPNPFVNFTQFWFTHNRPFESLEVQVQVMTVTGKVVWSKNDTITTTGFLSRDITWDGKDDFGDKIGKGVYVYKLTVKSLLTNSVTEKYEKLVIL